MIKQIIVAIKMVFKASSILASTKVLFAIVSAVSVPFSIYTIEKVTDAISDFGQPIFSMGRVFVWVSILVIVTVFGLVQEYLSTTIQLKLTRDLKDSLLTPLADKLNRIRIENFENSISKDVFFRLKNNPHEIVLSIFDTTLIFLRDVISIIGVAFLFIRISYWFFGLFLIILLPVLWCDYKSTVLVRRMHKEQTFAERELNYYESLLSNKNALQELRIMNAIKYIQDVWKEKANIVLKEHMSATVKSQLLMLSSTLLLFVFSISVMAMLLFGFFNQLISVATFVALVNSIQSVYSITYSLSGSITSLSRNTYEVEYFDEMYKMSEKAIGTTQLANSTYEIIFDHVTFSYPNSNEQILNNISFKFKTNEKICLVGRNGAGKSTIIKLLCGLYAPDGGNITINGIDLEEISAESLKKIRSVVFQEYFKYYSTIRENVAYGDLNKLNDDALIYDALNQAHALGFVDYHEKKLETTLGNLEIDSVDLSGGQWQKIAISRACLPKSKFIFMDEPTAALDPLAENTMYRELTKSLEYSGYLFVSHRLASAKMAERIIVIEKGEIVEDGSHEELMRKKGIYYTMFNEQSSWYTKIDKKEEIIR